MQCQLHGGRIVRLRRGAGYTFVKICTGIAGVLMIREAQLSDCFKFGCSSQPAFGQDFVYVLSARRARPRNRLGCVGFGSSLASGGGCSNLGRSIGRWLGWHFVQQMHALFFPWSSCPQSPECQSKSLSIRWVP